MTVQIQAAKATLLTSPASGFDLTRTPAPKTGQSNSSQSSTNNVAFAMRISPSTPDEMGATNSARLPSGSAGGNASSSTLVKTAIPAAGVSGSATRLFENSSTPQGAEGRIETAIYAPVATPADHVSSEPAAPTQAAPAAPSGVDALDEGVPASPEPVRSVHLQLSGENDQRVDVRLIEQGGSLALSVRSSDSTLTHTLQDRLPELNDRLAEQHYQSQIWLPPSVSETGSPGQPHAGARDPGSHQPGSDGAASRDSNSGKNRRSSDSAGGNPGQQQQRRQPAAPAWYQPLTTFRGDLQPWTIQQ